MTEQRRPKLRTAPSPQRRAYSTKPRTAPQHIKATPEREERIHLEDVRVYNLAGTTLAYQLAMAAHVVMAVKQGYSMQHALAVIDMAEGSRANVQRLCFDAMRHWGTTQFWVNRAVSNPPGPWLQALMCVSLTQLAFKLESEFVLVDQAVEAAINMKPHAKGLVNAILRRFLRERDEWEAAALTDEVATWNYPQWWIDALKKHYPDNWQNLLTVGNTHPPMTLRVNAQRGTVAEYLDYVKDDELGAHAMPDLSADAVILDKPCNVIDLPAFLDGGVSVQDAGAQLAADLLDVQDGMRVLDACAAPGGKTCHILERFDVNLLAIEKDASRAERIAENLERLDLEAEILVADANNAHQWWDRTVFERVLLDAPCSASGIVRRHPDIRWLREANDLEGLARQQAQLLRTMWKTLAVGGRLLYCTCSIFPEECEQVIAAFLTHTPNARRVDLPQMAGLQYSTGQLLPTAEPTRNHDGFYYAALTKVSD